MGVRRVAARLSALAALAALLASGANAQTASPSAAAALRVLDDQLAAYNASDKRAFLATLHFPHVRIAGAGVRVFPNAGSYMPELSMVQHGWDYARWTDRKVVQEGTNKVHVVATFTRYLASGRAIDSFDGLFIVVLKSGRWGVIARSSYPP